MLRGSDISEAHPSLRRRSLRSLCLHTSKALVAMPQSQE